MYDKNSEMRQKEYVIFVRGSLTYLRRYKKFSMLQQQGKKTLRDLLGQAYHFKASGSICRIHYSRKNQRTHMSRRLRTLLDLIPCII